MVPSGTLDESSDTGGIRDYTEAARWCRKAAERDHTGAHERLADLGGVLSANGIEQARRLAREWAGAGSSK